jgi:hypothetical protein
VANRYSSISGLYFSLDHVCFQYLQVDVVRRVHETAPRIWSCLDPNRLEMELMTYQTQKNTYDTIQSAFM